MEDTKRGGSSSRLALSRKPGERIVVGDGLVVIEVVAVKGDRVKLAITAPRELAVHREEVLNKIEAARAAESEG